MGKAAKLIMMRHGESTWNKKNVFTGWVDIPLSEKGIEEAIEGGKKIAHLPIDVIFVSALVRAQTTAMLAMLSHHSGKMPCMQRAWGKGREEWGKIHDPKAEAMCIPMISAWELNERMYGELQGMDKQVARERFGEEQVQQWRRSFDQAPPGGESLAMTAARAIPYFQKEILPYLEQGKNVFISAHGNSLRAIVMFLDQLSQEQVVRLELATGKPLLYTWSEKTWTKERVG